MKPSEFKISISVENCDEKLLKMTEIATLSKSAQFANYQRYPKDILNFDNTNQNSVTVGSVYRFK